MAHILLYGKFLYFPEDKSTYIPAVIQLVLLFFVVAFVFRWFIKKSKKDEQAARELEQRLERERQQRTQQNIQK